MKNCWITFVLVLVLLARPVSAQILGTGVMPVTEIGAQLWQTAAILVESLAQTAYMLQDLLAVEEIVLDDGYAETWEELVGIVEEAQGLSHDLTQLQAQVNTLFGLDDAPGGSGELRVRLAEIRRLVWDCNLYALKAQSLVRTLSSTMRHATGLVARISALAGNHQANQTMIEAQASMGETLAKLQAHTAITQKAETVERLQAALTTQAHDRIYEALLADYPEGVQR